MGGGGDGGDGNISLPFFILSLPFVYNSVYLCWYYIFLFVFCMYEFFSSFFFLSLSPPFLLSLSLSFFHAIHLFLILLLSSSSFSIYYILLFLVLFLL